MFRDKGLLDLSQDGLIGLECLDISRQPRIALVVVGVEVFELASETCDLSLVDSGGFDRGGLGRVIEACAKSP